MEAVGLAGVSSVAQRGVRLLLLVAERQEWCSLVCSSGLPSYPVARSRLWCRLCKVVGGFWKNFLFYVLCVALFAFGHLDFAFALVSFSPSGLWVFACGVRRFRDACAAWFDSGYMFYGRLWTNFSIFYVAVNSNPGAVLLHSV